MCEIINILPVRCRGYISGSTERLEEIRLRNGKEMLLRGSFGEKRTSVIINANDLRETLEYISGYSLYAYEEQLREGFITIKGGHRVGITGKAVMENGRIKTIKNISSVNIRISHEIKGCSNALMDYVRKNTLIISPPGMGKTTLLRDILRNISNRENEVVGIADERSEIAASYNGRAGNDVGMRTDVIDACPKDIGMKLLLRTMAPTYIGVDELGKKEDIDGVLAVMGGGANVVATVHGESLKEITKKKLLREMIEDERFQTYIEVNRKNYIIYDKKLDKLDEISR